jgi:hypothetical protein
VDYFGDIPGLQNGTFEISNEALSDNWLGQTLTIDQAQLFAAAPLYAALQLYVDHFGDPLKVARIALAKARGEKPDAR